MKNCLQTFTKLILGICLFCSAINLPAQNVRDGFCDYAIDIDCDTAIINQNTVGGPNVIWEYPQCNNYTFSGPEKVYRFTTTNSGSIQVDLNIHASNLDLDILLLSDNCSTPTCLAQSITSNANSQTEQIVYENAPPATYYLIVDSERDVGAFDLIVACNATQGCNLSYAAVANPVACGGTKGSIDVSIGLGKAPYKIEWDNADNTLWNTYTTSDKNYRIPNLPPGTYTVKVTDAMGCALMKNNLSVANTGGALDVQFSSTNAPCGSNFGWLNLDITGTSPPYWVTITGPKSGSVQITSNTSVVKDIPPGDYEITVEKGGCTKTGWATVGKDVDLNFDAEITDASCGGQGSFLITVVGGSPTYTIEWWHEDGTSDWVQSSNSTFSLNGMKPGEYTVKITGRNGCWKSKKLVMGSGNLSFDLEANSASCSSNGSIWVTIDKGTPGFVVEWTGPTEGWKNTDDKSFAIDDLIAGTYQITIVDAKGCKKIRHITVENRGGILDFDLEANGATCGGLGSIWVTINNGQAGYTVEWWGPNIAKWATTDYSSFQLKDLPQGEYTIKITDSKGCSNTKKIIVEDLGGGLDFALETNGATCGAKGSIWIDIKNGSPKYSVDINGPGVDKWFEATSSSIQVPELPAGNYTVVITDSRGCKGTEYITIEDNGGTLDYVTEVKDAGCGKNGEIWVTVNNGTPKFIIELWGPNNATFWAESQSSSFKLTGLESGEFTLKITDRNGCSHTTTHWVDGSTDDMSMDLEVNNATCSDDGRIWVTINGGKANYHLTWDGPTSGNIVLSQNGYQINNLRPGKYVVYVQDHYGCAYSKEVTVGGGHSDLQLRLESNNATCSQNGYLWADVINGEGPYEISWTGPTTGSMNVNNAGFQIGDLPAGDYIIYAKDKNGCEASKSISVYQSGGNVGSVSYTHLTLPTIYSV